MRVPVFYGHSEAIHIETRDKITADKARALLKKAPGVIVIDAHKPGGFTRLLSLKVQVKMLCMSGGFVKIFLTQRV